MKYTTTKTNNNQTTHIIEVSPSDFKIVLTDTRKKSAAPRNYCNAGFFATFSENNQYFTLPVAHLVCDYDATSSLTKHYCTERGKFDGSKFTFDSSTWSYSNPYYKKPISALLVNAKSNKAEIKEVSSLTTDYDYAISGIPIMRNGSSINFDKDVQSQGWDGSSLYGTWHIFIGLKQNPNSIYVIGMKTTTWNMVKTNEAYKEFKEIGFYDVIKLDGGGSFYMNVGGDVVASTSEDRRINTIICFGEEDKDDNVGKVDDKKDSVVNNKHSQTSDKSFSSNVVCDNKTNKIETNKESKPYKVNGNLGKLNIFNKLIMPNKKIDTKQIAKDATTINKLNQGHILRMFLKK